MSVKSPTLKDGLLVVFEGMDGVGKSTQLAMARETLLADNWPVHSTRNLGGTPIGEALREVMLSGFKRSAETDLYIALAIQEALVKAVKKVRAEGKIVLLDRGPFSVVAYQIYGSGLNESLGWRYVEAGMMEMHPDVTIVYRSDIKTALKRAKQKSKATDYFESKPLHYFERVAEGYAAAASRYKSKVAVVDADRPIDAVHHQTMQIIHRPLDKKI